jgi:hypothetical protein
LALPLAHGKATVKQIGRRAELFQHSSARRRDRVPVSARVTDRGFIAVEARVVKDVRNYKNQAHLFGGNNASGTQPPNSGMDAT